MTNKKNKIILIFSLLLCLIMSMQACFNYEIPLDGEAETVNESGKVTVFSHIKDNLDFKTSLHLIRNPENFTQTVFTGKGKFLDRTMDPDGEFLNLINNPKDKKAHYYYMTESVASVTTKRYEGLAEAYDDLFPVQGSIIYDEEGNEVNIGISNFSVEFELNNRFFIRNHDIDYYDNNLRIYDLNTSNMIMPPGAIVYYLDGHLLFSTERYSDNENEKKLITITDEDLNVVKTIEDYSIYSVEDKKDHELVIVSRSRKNPKYEENNDNNVNEYIEEYNYLDKDFNFIFMEPVETSKPYDQDIVEVKKGDIVFDYDFINFKKVSEDRPYKEKNIENNTKYKIKEQYTDVQNKIQKKDPKYQWTIIYLDEKTNKVRILAYYNEAYDDLAGYINDVDVYDEDGVMIGTLEKFDACYEEDGYFFYNYNTVSDFDLNVIKKFDGEFHLEQFEKFGKRFYSDKYDVRGYNERKKVTIMDENLNVIYKDVSNYEPYTLDDYLIVVYDGKTQFINAGFTPIKTISRSLRVSNWASESKYKAFEDMDTGLYGIIDDELNICIDKLRAAIDLKEQYFTFAEGFFYGLMDYEGGIIIDFSIFNTLPE